LILILILILLCDLCFTQCPLWFCFFAFDFCFG